MRIAAVVFSWLIVGCVFSASSTTPAAASQPAATGELTKSQRLAVRWIEVSLAAQKVFLYDGEEIAGAYLVSTGVVTGPNRTTYPGTYCSLNHMSFVESNLLPADLDQLPDDRAWPTIVDRPAVVATDRQI